MATISKEYYFLKDKTFTERLEEVQIKRKKNKFILTVQNAIKTRIRRDNDSPYINSSSREIKKWFGTRRI